MDIGTLSGRIELKDSFTSVSERAISSLEKAEEKAAKLGAKFKDIGRGMTLGVTVPLVGMAGAAIKAFSDFDAKMTESTAIMTGVTKELRTEMEGAARSVAKETTFSAAQAAEAYYFLASAGMDAKTSIAALPAVARFAQAGAFDLARATELVADSQSALGMTIRDDTVKNMENMIQVTDTLVKAAAVANASVEQFGTSLTVKAGNAMKDLNIDIAEGVAVLAVWADQGVKSEKAGERFNIVTRDLQNAWLKNKEVFQELNIAVFDSQGQFRSLADIMGEMETAFGSMSHEATAAKLAQMGFGSESIAATKSLIGTSERIREFTKTLSEAGGTTKTVADNQLQSFSGQMTILKNRLMDVNITIGSHLVPVLQSMGSYLEPVLVKVEQLAGKFGQLPPSVQASIIGFVALVAAIGPLVWIGGILLTNLGLLVTAMKGVMTMSVALSWPVRVLTAQIGIFGVTTGVSTTAAFLYATALSRLKAVLLGWPVAVVAAAIGGVVLLGNKLSELAGISDDTNRRLAQSRTGLIDRSDQIGALARQTNAAAKAQERLNNSLKTSNSGSRENNYHMNQYQTRDQAQGLYEPRIPKPTPIPGTTTTPGTMSDELRSLTDSLTGKALAARVKELGAAVAQAGKEGGISAHAYKELGQELSELVKKGASLSPVLEKIYLDFAKLNTQSLNVVSTQASLQSILNAVPGHTLKQAPKDWRDQRQFLPPSEEFVTTIDLMTGKLKTYNTVTGQVVEETNNKWEKQVAILSLLSDGFTKLAQVAQGRLSDLLSSVGQMFVLLETAVKMTSQIGKDDKTAIGGNWGAGSVLFSKNATGMQKAAAGVAGAMNVANGAMAAWNSGSALGGAMAGAQAGAMFGPWGAGIGAVAGGLLGLINRGKAMREENKKATASIQDYKSELTKLYGSLEDIAKLDKALGTDVAAGWQHQGKKGLEAFGKSAEELAEKLGEVRDEMSRIASEGGMASQTLINFRNAMPDDEGVQAFSLGQVRSAGSNIGGMLGAMQASATARDQKNAKDKGDEDWNSVIGKINLTATGAQAMSSILLAAWDGSAEGLRQMQPSLDILQRAMENSGHTGSEAFGQLVRMAALASDEIKGPMIDAIDFGTAALTNMHNAGFLTQDTFSGIVDEIMSQRKALLDAGTTSEDVNRVMQPSLQRIWELRKDNNFAVDDTTAALLKEAEAQGTVGDKFRSATDRMVIALESIATMFKTVFGDKLITEISRGTADAETRLGHLTRDRRINVRVDMDGSEGNPGGGPGVTNGGGGGTVNVNVDGDRIAHLIVPRLPGAVENWGLG